LAACIDQASAHVLAATIVTAARDRGLKLAAASDVREKHGYGVEGNRRRAHRTAGQDRLGRRRPDTRLGSPGPPPSRPRRVTDRVRRQSTANQPGYCCWRIRCVPTRPG
jgi:hypothetical protein